MVSRHDLGIYIYRIDPDDRISYVSDDWLHFAVENRAPELTRENVLGRPLWDFVTDAQTRNLYEAMLHRLRATRRSIIVDYRCDSPGLRRYMELTLIHLPDKSVELASRIVKLEPRPDVALLEAGLGRGETTLVMCSWCKKVKLDRHGWVEAEDAVQRLKLFDEQEMPQLTHGICPTCYEKVVHKGLDE